MISKGISIQWDDSVEYIGIDLSSLVDANTQIATTLEWWPKEKEWITYSTTSHIRCLSSGGVEIQVEYDKHRNPHLDADDICWGTSIIRIEQGAQEGEAEWLDLDDTSSNGVSKWKKIDIPLIGEKAKEKTSRLKRQQEQFRLLLLAYDKCCVLTGEKTESALEAAHIIPASRGGAEVIENGILLRADIHRLLDNNLISLNEKGEVVTTDGLSDSYERLLHGAHLNYAVLERVKAALSIIAGEREGVGSI